MFYLPLSFYFIIILKVNESFFRWFDKRKIINKCVCNYCITRFILGLGERRERSGVGGLEIKERERRGKNM